MAKDYPVSLADAINYFDRLAIACVDEEGKEDLMGMALSASKYLEELEKLNREVWAFKTMFEASKSPSEGLRFVKTFLWQVEALLKEGE